MHHKPINPARRDGRGIEEKMENWGQRELKKRRT